MDNYSISERADVLVGYVVAMRDDGVTDEQRFRFLRIMREIVTGELSEAETESIGALLRVFRLDRMPTALLCAGNDQRWLH